MDATELILLYDYYGALLTDRQRDSFELRYNQHLSLGEIAQELGISRQGVHDNLTRSEALLQNMEEKTGCVRRDLHCRKAAVKIHSLAQQLTGHNDPTVSDLARQIVAEAEGLEE